MTDAKSYIVGKLEKIPLVGKVAFANVHVILEALFLSLLRHVGR